MLLRNIDYLTRDPEGFLIFLALTIFGLVICITIHEFSHAFVAVRLGDDHARSLGRLTLNPLAHLDLMGSLMLLFVGFGWGKPVPVDPRAIRGNPIQGMAMIAFAGPLSNILMASLLAIPFKFGVLIWPFTSTARVMNSPIEQMVGTVLGILVFFNLLLAIFNLIPIAPLDGSKVILGLVPRDLARALHRLEPWGPGVLLSIIMLDWFLDTRILTRILGPGVNVLSNLLVGHSIF
jgi:Zn-dependent protease